VSIRASRTTAVALVTAAAFADILAYSIAVPVLPDLSRRLGASPTTIGFLFASFGVSVLMTSVPMGSMSDRMGRRGPLLAGAAVLAASTLIFAFAETLPWLFAARLVQGAADAVTWVVGFALIADLYNAEERGRVMGLVMSGTTVGFLIGPTLGGWLYESGGPQLPYLVVAALSAACAAGFAWMQLPPHQGEAEPVRLLALLRVREVAICALTVVLGGGTLAMVEPTLSLFLGGEIGLGPTRIGLVIGCGEHRLPTLASVGAVLDTNNASVIYGEREKLLHIAERECRRGHGEVVFVRDATAASALALVDARR